MELQECLDSFPLPFFHSQRLEEDRSLPSRAEPRLSPGCLKPHSCLFLLLGPHLPYSFPGSLSTRFLMSQIHHKRILISGSSSKEQNRTAAIQIPALSRDAVGKGNSVLMSEHALQCRSQELQSHCHLPPSLLFTFKFLLLYHMHSGSISAICILLGKQRPHCSSCFPSVDWVKCSKYPVIPSLVFLSLDNICFLQLPGIKSCGYALVSLKCLCVSSGGL